MIIVHRIGKKEVKGREAVLFTLEFFVCYPYNTVAMYEGKGIGKEVRK